MRAPPSVVVVLSIWDTRPRFHCYDADRYETGGFDDRGRELTIYRTACGRVAEKWVRLNLRSPWHQSVSSTDLPLRHAEKFAEPCKVCFPRVSDMETP